MRILKLLVYNFQYLTIISGKLLWWSHKDNLKLHEEWLLCHVHRRGPQSHDIQYGSLDSRWLPAGHHGQDGIRKINVEKPGGYWGCWCVNSGGKVVSTFRKTILFILGCFWVWKKQNITDLVNWAEHLIHRSCWSFMSFWLDCKEVFSSLFGWWDQPCHIT